MSAALTKTGVWNDGEPEEPPTDLPARRERGVPGRAELEARLQRREEHLDQLGEQLKEIATDLIDLAEANRSEPVHAERDERSQSDSPSSPPPAPGPSGRSSGSSHSDDWGSDGHDFSWD